MAAVAPIAAQPGASDEQPLPVADFVVDPTVSLLTITKPTPDAKLGLVMTAGASPKVHSLSPDGLAAAAGLMVGDAILTVNRAPVDTDVMAQQAMQQAPKSVTLGFLRNAAGPPGRWLAGDNPWCSSCEVFMVSSCCLCVGLTSVAQTVDMSGSTLAITGPMWTLNVATEFPSPLLFVCCPLMPILKLVSYLGSGVGVMRVRNEIRKRDNIPDEADFLGPICCPMCATAQLMVHEQKLRHGALHK